MPGSSNWSLSLRFPDQNPVCTCILPIRATCPAYLNHLDLITRMVYGQQYISLSFSLCSFPLSSFTSFLLSPNILLNTLFSKTLGLRSSLNVSDQVPHPYKTTRKILALCIFNLFCKILMSESSADFGFTVNHVIFFNIIMSTKSILFYSACWVAAVRQFSTPPPRVAPDSITPHKIWLHNSS